MNVHQLDQAFAVLADMSKLMYKYYDELVEAGFAEKQAMEMAKDYQRSMIQG